MKYQNYLYNYLRNTTNLPTVRNISYKDSLLWETNKIWIIQGIVKFDNENIS